MDDLAKLFAEYRDAIPDPEPSADFTPGVWRRIETRRSSVRLFRRFAEAFVTIAAVLTILMGTVLIPHLRKAPVYTATYVDVLAAEQTEEAAAMDALPPRIALPEAPR
jgi:hypothetical protein